MRNSTPSPSDSPLQIWINREDNNFVARLAQRSELPLNDKPVGSTLLIPRRDFSLHTSLCARAESEEDDDNSYVESVTCEMVPSLTRGTSTASSSTSSALDTDIVSIIDGGHVLEDHDGILMRPNEREAHADLICPFGILDCSARFASVIDFKYHVFSHFRGHALPDFAPCFLCSRVLFRRPADDPSLIWNELLSHMVHEHLRSGEEIGAFRADIALMRYMWNRRIITEAEYKRSQLVAVPTRLPGRNVSETQGHVPEAPMAPPATPPSPVQAHLNQTVGLQSESYVMMASRRQERRQRDNTRLIARVRGHL